MYKFNERRVRSLDDIPEVFNLRNNQIRSLELKISKKPSEKKTRNYEELGRSERYVLVLLKIDDEESQGECKEDKLKENVSEESTITVDSKEKFENNTKINPLDEPKFVRMLAKEGDYDSTRGNKQKKRIWSLIDVLLSMVLIAPLTVGFWRGIWGLMDLHNDRFPGILCFVLGSLVHTGFAIFKSYLHGYVFCAWRKKSWAHNALFKIAQIPYTYVFGVACNAQWRGGWMIFDHFFGGHSWIIVGTMLAIVAILAALRSVRNLIAVPLVVFIDKLTYVFYFPTRYKLGIPSHVRQENEGLRKVIEILEICASNLPSYLRKRLTTFVTAFSETLRNETSPVDGDVGASVNEENFTCSKIRASIEKKL